MQTSLLKREFIYERGTAKTTLADPDSSMSPNEVLKFYARTYPELITASVVGPAYKDDKVTYSFKTTVGVKG